MLFDSSCPCKSSSGPTPRWKLLRISSKSRKNHFPFFLCLLICHVVFICFWHCASLSPRTLTGWVQSCQGAPGSVQQHGVQGMHTWLPALLYLCPGLCLPNDCTLDGSGEQETNNQWKVGGNVGIAKLLLTLYALLSLWTSLLKHKFKDRIIKNFKRWQQSINLQVWVPFLILELHSWASSFMSLISSLRPSLGGGGLRIDS